MTKTLKTLAAMGAMMLAACSSEEMITDLIGDQTTVTYTVSLPSDMSTRAYSDGETATYLTYAVYRNGDEGALELVDEQLRKNQFVNLQATVSLQLLKGYSYTIVFWADAGPKCPYTIDLESGTITMDYAEETTIVGNNEERDAFYQVETISNLSTAINEEIKLYRPFAQLNFGTNDLQADIVRNNAPVGDIEFSVEVPAGLPTTLSLITGEASEETEEPITFVYTGVPAESDGTFPVEGYEYVSMNYILASDDVNVLSDAVTLTATHEGLGEDGVVCTVNNVPLQRNYRTNIYGSLLTAPAEYTITICPHYIDDFFIMEYEGVFYRAYCDVDMMLDAISKGFNVALLKDMEVSSTIEITTALEDTLGINLNGYTLKSTASDNCITATSEVPLSIVNGTIDAAHGIDASVAVTLDDVTMTSGSTESTTTEYCVKSTSSLTITDCTLTAEVGTGTGSDLMSHAVLVALGTATIENSTLKATCVGGTSSDLGTYAVAVRNELGDVTITGCTIEVESASYNCFAPPIYSGTANENDVKLTVRDCTLKSRNTSSMGYAYGAYVRSGEALFDYCLLDVWAENSGQNQATRGININCGNKDYYATVYASNCTFNIKAKGNAASSAASVFIHKNTSSQAAMYLLDGCKLTSTLDPNVNNYTPADIHLDSSSYGNVYYTSGVTFTDGTNTPVVVNSGYGGVTLGTYTYPATAE